MLTVAASLSTISSFATGAGTLVLALATFAAVRSSQRSARISEVALQEQRRPILTQSRLDDPVQKIMFVEGRWVHARGGHGVAEHDGSVYLAMSLRNVGAGIGVCQAWHVAALNLSDSVPRAHTPEDQFRLQTRDLYIPAGDIGMWQGALRDRNDATYRAVAAAIDNRGAVSVELLYTDQVGGQRTISRFLLTPYEVTNDEGEVRLEWFASINRHWYLDRPGPRSDDQVDAAVGVIVREREAAEAAAAEEAQAAEATDLEGEAEAEEVEAARSGEPHATERTVGDRPTPGGDGMAPGGDGAAPDRDGAAPVRRNGAEPVTVIPRPNCE